MMRKIRSRRQLIRTVLLVVAALWLGYREYAKSSSASNGSATNRTSERSPAAGRAPDGAGASNEHAELVLTKHARCRMGCRHLDLGEIQEVLAGGRVNPRKSNPQARPCPVAAYEGRTSDGQLARIVVAECAKRRKVVTVIDLENKYDCHCK